ncbi:M16 family metallopeptidase [Qipengyuania psychrotolerans]|uniref:Insulinase family protein n=1 Tax=Qipengyuania psychrotolerans TaxID=2867238 RepID=A0ABX8ZG49_9SPHN|nr:M16 family metallopeptidase [Qipengyuania psychrotolerans]QZD87879.1 insulinase family protein [Qipengyuania psychrotolerans]
MTDFPRAARRFAILLPFAFLAAQPMAAQEAAVPASLQAEGEVPWIYEGSDVPRDQEWLFGELNNGLRYGVRENGVPPNQVSIRVRIDAGSLYENDNELGYAHLLEHLLFRESKYLGVSEAIPTWQRLGATFGSDTNAETSPTHTVYKLDLPNVDPAKLEESMKLLSGMVRAPVLSDGNVRTEVPIVLAEKRERGGVGERVAETSMKTLFAGQRLAERLTIGTEESLESATGRSVQAFYDRWYRPENTVISVVGDLDPILFASLVEKYFQDWSVSGEPAPAPVFGDPIAPAGADADNPVGEVAVMVEPTLPRAMTYGYFRPWRQVQDTVIYNEGRLREQLALQLINRRLESRARGGGSYLYAQVSEAKISRSTHATLVQFAPLTEDWQAALDDVRGVIADAIAEPPTLEELQRELDEMEVGYANLVEQRSVLAGSGYADDLVNAVDIREAIAAPETFLMVFNSMREKATPESVLAETRELFEGNVIRATYITPAAGEATEESLQAALSRTVMADGDARVAAQTVSFDDLPPVGEPGTLVERAVHAFGQVERVKFDNGVQALLLANENEPGRVAVKVRFGAGIRAFAPEDAALIQLGEAALIQSGFGDIGQNDLDRLATGRKFGFEFGIGEGAFTFDAQTRKQDLEDQLYLFAAKLGMPRWDELPFARAKAAAKSAFDSYESSPAGIVNRDLEYFVYGQDSRFKTATPEMLDAATLEDFRNLWEPALRQGPIEVLIFGDYDKEAAIETLRRTFGALPDREPIPAEDLNRDLGFATPGETLVRYHQGEADQAAAVVAWPVGAGPAEIRKSRQLAILTEVFNNRLRDAMREQAGASYAPVVRLDWPIDVETGGTVTALAQLRPGDVPSFFAAADKIARDLTQTPPTVDELSQATEPLRNYYERISSGNYFFLLQLENSTVDPRRMRSLRGLLNDYSQTTPEAMQALAQEYFGDKSGWRMAVIPQGQDLATAVSSSPATSGR